MSRRPSPRPLGLGRRFATVSVVTLLTCLSAFALLSSLDVSGAAPSGAVTQFSVPSSLGVPSSITPGPDGALWFAASNGIGRVTTQGSVSIVLPQVVVSGGNVISRVPTAITTGPDGALWFTDSEDVTSSASHSQFHAISRISIAGVVTDYPLPVPTCACTQTVADNITAGPDGALWFTATESSTANPGTSYGLIGRITTTGAISEFSLPIQDSDPLSIVAGSDGALWFTEVQQAPLTPVIGRITTSGVVTEYPFSLSNGLPAGFGVFGNNGMVSGPDGSLWFTLTTPNQIGRMTTSGSLTVFPTGTPIGFSNPNSIATGPDGNLWFTVDGSCSGSTLVDAQVGRMTPAGSVTLFSVSEQPYGIAAGSDGELWFAEYVNPCNGVFAGSIGQMATGASPLVISTPSLAAATLGLPYSSILLVTGGTPPYTFTVTAGSLPSGLSLSSGVISGIPTGSPGTFDFTVTVGDSSSPSQSASAAFAIVVTGRTPEILNITDTTLTPYKVGPNGGGGAGGPYTGGDILDVFGRNFQTGDTVCFAVDVGYRDASFSDGSHCMTPSSISATDIVVATPNVGLANVGTALVQVFNPTSGISSHCGSPPAIGCLYTFFNPNVGQLIDNNSFELCTATHITPTAHPVAVLVTAAHCLQDHSKTPQVPGTKVAWAPGWFGFYCTDFQTKTPAGMDPFAYVLTCGTAPYGIWEGTILVRSPDWNVGSGKPDTADYAFVGLDPSQDARLAPLGATVTQTLAAHNTGLFPNSLPVSFQAGGSLSSAANIPWTLIGDRGISDPPPHEVPAFLPQGFVTQYGCAEPAALSGGVPGDLQMNACRLPVDPVNGPACPFPSPPCADGEAATTGASGGPWISSSGVSLVNKFSTWVAHEEGIVGTYLTKQAQAVLQRAEDEEWTKIGVFVPAGGNVSTPPPITSDPVQTRVTTPNAGTVSIETTPTTVLPTAWQFLTKAVAISAPPATAANPLVISFELDKTIVPPGSKAIQVFKNGIVVLDCRPGTGASPDPCVAGRQSLANGNAIVTVRTSTASMWSFAFALTTTGKVIGDEISLASGGVADFEIRSNGSRVRGELHFSKADLEIESESLDALAIASDGRSAWFAGVTERNQPFLAYVQASQPGTAAVFKLLIAGTAVTGTDVVADGEIRILVGAPSPPEERFNAS